MEKRTRDGNKNLDRCDETKTTWGLEIVNRITLNIIFVLIRDDKMIGLARERSVGRCDTKN